MAYQSHTFPNFVNLCKSFQVCSCYVEKQSNICFSYQQKDFSKDSESQILHRYIHNSCQCQGKINFGRKVLQCGHCIRILLQMFHPISKQNSLFYRLG